MEDQNKVALRSQLREQLNLINSKLDNLKEISESPFKTNGEFRFNPAYTQGSPINIHRLSDLSVLLGVLGAVKGHSDKYEEAARILNLEQYPQFTWCGFPYSAWEHDCKVRAAVITQHDKLSKLRKAKEKLQQFLTEEDKLALVLKEISEL